jgi:hypothetical protein
MDSQMNSQLRAPFAVAILLVVGMAGCARGGVEKAKALVIVGDKGADVAGEVAWQLQNGTMKPNLREPGIVFVLRRDFELPDGTKGKTSEIFRVVQGGKFERKGLADLKLTNEQLAAQFGITKKP